MLQIRIRFVDFEFWIRTLNLWIRIVIFLIDRRRIVDPHHIYKRMQTSKFGNNIFVQYEIFYQTNSITFVYLVLGFLARFSRLADGD